MLLIAFAILLLMTLVGFYMSRDVFSPFVIQPGIWVVILLLYFVMNPPYYPVVNQFPGCLVVWSVSFAIGAYGTHYLMPEKLHYEWNEPNRTVLRIYIWVASCVVPLMLFIIIRSALANDPEHLLLYIRMLNVTEGESADEELPDFGLLNYFVPIAYILLFFSLMYSKGRKERIWVIVLNLMVAFLTMAKTNFLSILFAALYILYLKGKVKLKTIGGMLLAFLAFSVVFQFFRSSEGGKEGFGVDQMFSLYFFASFVAFDYFVQPLSSAFWGEHIFRIYYAVSYALGGDVPPVETIQGFVSVPVLANTFTVLQPFFVDFGYLGLVAGGMLYGAFYVFLYNNMRGGSAEYRILYTIFLNFLVLQFFAEYILANFSLSVQYVLYALLPFMVNKIVKR